MNAEEFIALIERLPDESLDEIEAAMSRVTDAKENVALAEQELLGTLQLLAEAKR